ncbi:MAG: hypothetical protein AB1782_18535 [Cyanobacteriota bacterium]
MTINFDNLGLDNLLNNKTGNKPNTANKTTNTDDNFFTSNNNSSNYGLDSILGDLSSDVDQVLSDSKTNPPAQTNSNDPLSNLFKEASEGMKEAKKTSEDVQKSLEQQKIEAAQKQSSLQKAVDSVPVINKALENGDGKALINTLENMTPAERGEAEKAYALKHARGNPMALRTEIKDKLSGSDETKAMDLLNEGIQNDPKMAVVALAEAMENNKTDNKTIDHIINNSSDKQLTDIQSTYDSTMKKPGALKEAVNAKYEGNNKNQLLNKLDQTAIA